MFQLDEVPADPQIAAKTLSQMARRDPRVERITKGWYIRVVPASEMRRLFLRDRGLEAIRIAGPGAGYAGASAVNEAGWNWQPTAYNIVCVAGRAPRATLEFCKFVSRANQARRDLTWAEVTLLEALRCWQAPRYDWDECVERVKDGTTANRFGPTTLIRAAELRRVGELERGTNDRFRDRLRSLTDALPPVIEHQRPN